MIDPQVEQYWLGRRADGSYKDGGVDLYLGGAEHAVLHLLYARFWHKVLYDLGYVTAPEPFARLFNQGMIQSYAYQDSRGAYIPYDEIEFRGEDAYRKKTGEKLTAAVEKMSKSKGNVVNPDAIIQEYGADTLRLYEMYMGPLEASKPWNTRDIIGVHRLLQRIWRLVVEPVDAQNPDAGWRLNPRIGDEDQPQLERLLHKTIRKVQEDIERFAFNTAIAQMFVWTQQAQKSDRIGRSQIERFLRVLAPFAPHIAEELWHRLGHETTITLEPWPEYDPALTVDETVEIAVQINGKVRGRITIPADASEDQIIEAARADERIATALSGRQLRRTIVVPRRLVNLIVG
ncbi:MAG: hypothetical protein D6760_05185 [Deltaproteobacteria bacterium]|nr:MAG: hypothetical protein D6760_05185 [Deltaproteobacteria bacterium]